MSPIVACLLLTLYAVTPSEDSRQGPGTSYQTTKSLAALQKCLTDKLSERGDVTALSLEGITTLMLREGTDEPMLIDLAPPSVKVTTKFVHGTRKLVEACL